MNSWFICVWNQSACLSSGFTARDPPSCESPVHLLLLSVSCNLKDYHDFSVNSVHFNPFRKWARTSVIPSLHLLPSQCLKIFLIISISINCVLILIHTFSFIVPLYKYPFFTISELMIACIICEGIKVEVRARIHDEIMKVLSRMKNAKLVACRWFAEIQYFFHRR